MPTKSPSDLTLVDLGVRIAMNDSLRRHPSAPGYRQTDHAHAGELEEHLEPLRFHDHDHDRAAGRHRAPGPDPDPNAGEASGIADEQNDVPGTWSLRMWPLCRVVKPATCRQIGSPVTPRPRGRTGWRKHHRPSMKQDRDDPCRPSTAPPASLVA